VAGKNIKRPVVCGIKLSEGLESSDLQNPYLRRAQRRNKDDVNISFEEAKNMWVPTCRQTEGYKPEIYSKAREIAEKKVLS
jgi:hypothetical protein